MNDLSNEHKLLLSIPRSILNNFRYQPDKEVLKSIDWMELLTLSKRQKVFPMMYAIYNKYIPEEYIGRYNQEYTDFTDKITA
ncbi:MAG: hypothetical protein MJB12_07100, partial [Firmicutes bacterium]|nr:hypothetical protein [Bacillota bacterium]